MTADEARMWLHENNIKFILAQFVDIHGVGQGEGGAGRASRTTVLTDGAGFAGFAIWGLGMGPHGPDYMAVGDLATLTPMPWMPGLRAHRRATGTCNGEALGLTTRAWR